MNIIEKTYKLNKSQFDLIMIINLIFEQLVSYERVHYALIK